MLKGYKVKALQGFICIFTHRYTEYNKNMSMKKYFKFSTFILAGTLLCSSCIGSFGLFNRVLAWNKEVTDNKFINEVLFVVISPAYAVCSFIDLIVFNSVEFWSGSNPMAHRVGKTQQILGEDGKYYAVKTLKDGYEITKPNGEVLQYLYDRQTDSWSQVVNGETKELFRFNKDGSICTSLPDGRKMDVTLNEAGVYKVRMAVNQGNYWAFR